MRINDWFDLNLVVNFDLYFFSKGVAGSRKAVVDKFELYPDLKYVKNAYKDSVLQLFKYIYKCADKESCCELEIESNRFQWCKQYFCYD